MAIAPLQLPGPLIVPQIDWSPLNAVGDAYVKNQERQREAAAFGGLVESIPTRGTAATPLDKSSGLTAPAGPPGGELPRGLRNNNPGNIEDGPLAKSLPGYKGSDGRFAVFDTPENGLGAMDALLISYGRRGLKTVGDVIGRWAPASDNNNVGAYARFVSPNGDPNAPIDLSDPQQRREMIGKMSMFENGMHGGMPQTAPPPAPADVIAAGRGMTPDMKKRVQALFAVGSPTATAAGLALVSKFIGKQEPVKLGEGDVLVDPDSGQIVGRAPGKSQAVREGGAIVQDGKLIYQAPDRPQNVAPGGTLVQNGKPVFAAPANAHLQEVELPDGTKMPVIFDPQTGKVRMPTQDELKAAQTGELPHEVNPKIVREQRSKAFVANEEDAAKNAKAAADFKPLVDQAVAAYQRAIDKGAIGQIAGSPAGRIGARYVWGGEAERARQDYDKALAGIQARITAAQNKGEGAVSNFERAMYAAQFPDLQANDPADMIKYLKQLQAHTQQTIETGGKSIFGQQPSISTERPAVVTGKPGQAAATPQIQEGSTATNPQTGERIIFRGGKWQTM